MGLSAGVGGLVAVSANGNLLVLQGDTFGVVRKLDASGVIDLE